MLNKESILLKRLTIEDAEAFHNLYFPKFKQGRQSEVHIGIDKTPSEFAEFIASVCNEIFTIRMAANPDIIIGDCALHHWNKENYEIEIGGFLLPAYWGKGIMANAFGHLICLAREEYNAETLVAKTEPINKNALKFAKKMGFDFRTFEENKVVLFKRLDEH
ncbi:MAG TPA: GNAT family N-acetyltransferase [Niabella sp.]|nr:GNAT family N-acetyltransferase [Niabella sp.]